MDPKHSHGPDRIDYQETGGDITEVHAAIQREHPEPTAEVTPIPLWLTGVCGLAVLWAGAYLGTFHGGFRGDVFDERATSPSMLFASAGKATGPGAGGAPVAQRSLADEGKAVFGSICASCHQPSGQGVPGTFPPLVNSPWVVGSEKRLIAIILKGFSGPLTVLDKQYNNVMPPQESALNDHKIAAVASYVRSAWGNAAPEITEGKVKTARQEFASRPAQWTEAELSQIPADATLADAGPAPGAAPAAGAAAAPAEDLTALGKAQYGAICVACHQPTGTGLPGAFPPLVKSEYVTGDPKRVVAIILKGVMGPIVVNGQNFNNVMPPQGPVLDDKKVAAIATFVRKQFGPDASPVTPALVKEVRAATAAKAASYTESELKAFSSGGDAAPAPAPAPVGAAAPAQ